MLGSIILSLALLSSFVSMLMYLNSYYKKVSLFGNNETKNLALARYAYHVMTICVILASAVLWQALLTHQYQYKYVFSYSNNELTTGFLISAFWGGQEGSFLLWLLSTSLVGIVLQYYSMKRGDLEPRVMAVFTLATTFLLVMVSPMFKNPFEYIWESGTVAVGPSSVNPIYVSAPWIMDFVKGEVLILSEDLSKHLATLGISFNQFLVDGRGLNPQLLNFWMQIHPPILFLGFSMATVPFSFAVASLIKNEYNSFVKQSLPWVLAGTGILGLGIMMGGYWAYEMLGWGGYWAWDPVENSSLVPWLIGVATIHTMLVQKKTQSDGSIGRFTKTNLMLSLMIYILVLYSTFLTRSGVLGNASVHSFVDPGMMVYTFLLLFIATFLFLGIGLIVYRWKSLERPPIENESTLSRDLALFTASIILIASAIIVATGTSAPIFGSAVDTSFYNEMHLPLAIIVGLLNGFSLLLKWKSNKGVDFAKKLMVYFGIAVILTLGVVVIGGVTKPLLALLALSALFTIVVNVDICLKIVRGNKKMIGAYIAHIGIAIFILGVIGSASYDEEKHLLLEKGVPQEAFGYKIVFQGINVNEKQDRVVFNVDLEKDGKTYKAFPLQFYSMMMGSWTPEPDILSFASKDVYISPKGYDPGTAEEHNHGKQVMLKKGETIESNGLKLTLNSFGFPPGKSPMDGATEFEIDVNLTIEGTTKEEVILKQYGGNTTQQNTTHVVKGSQIQVTLAGVDADTKGVGLIINDPAAETHDVTPGKEILTISASIKPFVGLVWIGVLVLVLGFAVSMLRRLRESTK